MTADQQNVLTGRIAANIMVSVLDGDKVPELIMPPIRELTADNIDKVDWSYSAANRLEANGRDVRRVPSPTKESLTGITMFGPVSPFKTAHYF
jgi:hypothetical protein